MIIPSSLQDLGFLDIPLLADLNQRSYKVENEIYLSIEPWASLRDVFEYVACMEHSVSVIDKIPRGKELNSGYLTPARYDSVSLVLFAQATLDNLAAWLNRVFNIGLKSAGVSFYWPNMARALTLIDGDYGNCLAEADAFIQRLNYYRMEWLHRMSGGAVLCFNAPPDDPSCYPEIMVPLDPLVLTLQHDTEKYLQRIEAIRAEHDGEWMVPVSEFAHDIKEGVFKLILDLLNISAKNIN
ncbi:hypothetical protein [Pseudomonas rhodesiae]|uniref:hypothetical protein n=1 Tax=Pseudomonas rhodesiae TaxID=76760 RepID=UPI0028A6B2E4|nr:hypothetical protein [Pseudomonas rhodesiae]